MRRRKQILGLGLLLAAATSVPALAQPTTASPGYPACSKAVSPGDSELAHQRYIAGKQDYDEGNYDSAVRRFRDAYTLDCTKHELLVIISASHERRGDKKEAVLALETYIARAPTAPDVSTYQAKIDNLKKQIAAAPPATTAPTATASTTAPTGTAPAPSGETREHTIYPWIVTGAGVVALGVGIVLLATAPSLPLGCDAGTGTCARQPGDSDSSYQEHQDRAGKSVGLTLGGTITIVGGAALIAGGIVWHLLEPTGPKESAKTRLRPTVTPNYAGLALGGTF